MVKTNFNDIILTRNEKRALKKLKHKKRKYGEVYEPLINYDFAIYSQFEQDELLQLVPIKEFVEITETGLAYLRSCKKENFRYWFPIISADVLSAAALITSIIALLK